jgi:mutator protein MutT
MKSQLTPVLAAVIRRDSKFLLAQRPSGKRHGGLWEFPGGKLVSGEDHLAAARRELAEELGVEVLSVGPVLFRRQDPGSEFLIEFAEVLIEGDPQALEHQALAWLEIHDLYGYELAPTDRAFVQSLQIRAAASDKPGTA